MLWIQAEWRTQIFLPHGAMKCDTGWRKNVVCDSAFLYMAEKVKDPTSDIGLKQLAVGDGDPTEDSVDNPMPSDWDRNPPTPLATRTRLVHEIGRVPLAANQIRYLDAQNAEVAGATNRLLIDVTIGGTLLIGNHREYGLFYGADAGAVNSGSLFNYETHGKIEKRSGEEARIRIRIEFGRRDGS